MARTLLKRDYLENGDLTRLKAGVKQQTSGRCFRRQAYYSFLVTIIAGVVVVEIIALERRSHPGDFDTHLRVLPCSPSDL